MYRTAGAGRSTPRWSAVAGAVARSPETFSSGGYSSPTENVVGAMRCTSIPRLRTPTDEQIEGYDRLGGHRPCQCGELRNRVIGRGQADTGATDGNLGSHPTTLEKAGFVRIVKDFVGRRPRTRIGTTAQGKRAFQDHVAYLHDILDGHDGQS